MADSSAATPSGPAGPPARRPVPQMLVVGVLVAGVLLLCGIMAAWGMVEAMAHGPNGLSWDPPSLHATATLTTTAQTDLALAETMTPATPVPTEVPTETVAPTAVPTLPPTVAPSPTAPP